MLVNGNSITYQNINSASDSSTANLPIQSTDKAQLNDEISTYVSQMSLDDMVDQDVDFLSKHQLITDSLIVNKYIAHEFSYYEHASASDVAITAMTRHQQEGLNNNEASDQLLARLEQSAVDINSAYRNASDFLFDIGQLGPDQKSFIASSENRVDKANLELGSNEWFNRYSNNEGDDNRFSVSVETQEGDIVTINFSSAQSYHKADSLTDGQTVDSFQLSYEVEGDLSEEEHAAMTEILAGIGGLADEYFSNLNYNINTVAFNKHLDHQFDMNFLNEFDSEQLASFDLSFSTSGSDTQTLTNDGLDISYNFDKDKESQELDFHLNAGMTQIKFNVDMSVFGQQDAEQMERYLKTIEDNFLEKQNMGLEDDVDGDRYERQKEELTASATQFSLFKNAFESMSGQANQYTKLVELADETFENGRELVANLTKEMMANDPRYIENNNENTLGNGISKLADFDAEFNFKSFDTPSHHLVIEQTTSEESSPTYQGVIQNKNITSSYNADNAANLEASRMNGKNTENYTVSAGIEGYQVVALDQKYNSLDESKKYDYVLENSQWNEKLVEHNISETEIESSIRLVEDLWIEQSSQEKSESNTSIHQYGREPATTINKQSHSSLQLTRLIGQLDDLLEDNGKIEKVNEKLSSVGLFMDRFSDKA